MCARSLRPDVDQDEFSRTIGVQNPGSWAAVKDATAELLRRKGELNDPATDQDAVEEVSELAATLVAYACVPGSIEGNSSANRPGTLPATSSAHQETPIQRDRDPAVD